MVVVIRALLLNRARAQTSICAHDSIELKPREKRDGVLETNGPIEVVLCHPGPVCSPVCRLGGPSVIIHNQECVQEFWRHLELQSAILRRSSAIVSTTRLPRIEESINKNDKERGTEEAPQARVVLLLGP
ncbi:hypothetical protein K438DRAFT_412959 [Mycena galopus ATCC 62051]|nr:hypothetical protein K438DRAFT_412959 [Mycena galopus ATCC 62051]